MSRQYVSIFIIVEASKPFDRLLVLSLRLTLLLHMALQHACYNMPFPQWLLALWRVLQTLLVVYTDEMLQVLVCLSLQLLVFSVVRL